MTYLLGFLAAVALLALIAWLERRRLHRRLISRLAREWGNRSPSGDWDTETASEEWLLSAASSHTSDWQMDARTWADLELDRLLAGIDDTRTALGSQRLFARLCSGEAWSSRPALEELVLRILADPDLRNSIGLRLAMAGPRMGAGFWLITQPDAIRLRWWYWGFPVLAVAMLASLIAIPLLPKLAIPAAAVVVILNLGARMSTAWQVPGILAPMRQMGRLISTAEQLAPSASSSYAGPESVVHDIAKLRPLRRISAWVGRDPMRSGDLLAGAWEYLNLLFILDANAILFGARHLRASGAELGRIARWIGDVDLAYSVASLRASSEAWSVPTRSSTRVARVVGAWHPLVPEPVANDATIVPGRGIVLTGANMSGKSTYLRTVGIAAVLARVLNTCPARSWEGELFRVRSLIGRQDDLSAGKSYYQVEAEGVVTLLRDALDTIPTLFLLDELLRGTNTVERLAAGEAVLNALLDDGDSSSPHSVIVATHDGELVRLLHHRYQPFHFRETISSSGLHFEYRRHEGAASTRTAIALLAAVGAPEGVVEAANARAASLDRAAGGSN